VSIPPAAAKGLALTPVTAYGEIGHKNFWLLNLATEDKRLLALLPADTQVHDFDVSASGGDIVFDRTEAGSEMTLIDRTPTNARL
jgi:hypothetical protein